MIFKYLYLTVVNRKISLPDSVSLNMIITCIKWYFHFNDLHIDMFCICDVIRHGRHIYDTKNYWHRRQQEYIFPLFNLTNEELELKKHRCLHKKSTCLENYIIWYERLFILSLLQLDECHNFHVTFDYKRMILLDATFVIFVIIHYLHFMIKLFQILWCSKRKTFGVHHTPANIYY